MKHLSFIKGWLFFGITFLTYSVQAQKIWTLAECIQYANKHNLVIQQVTQASRIDDINLEQSKAERLPSLSATASAGRNWGRSFNSVNVALVDGGFSTANFGVNMSLPLFNGLSTHNTIKQNRLFAQSGHLDVLASQENYSILIAQSYLQVLQLKEQIRNTENQMASSGEELENALSQYQASEKQLKLNERLFENAQYSHESGLISTTDFTIEKNNYLNAENSMALAKYQYLFSRMILDFYNGRPMGFN